MSLKIACVYWKRRKLNPIAIGRYPRHDERINGGFNGLEDRSSYIRKAKEALVRIEGILTGALSDRARRGSTGDAVGDLQAMLSKLKFPLAIDRDFGAATELAIMRFQGDKSSRLTASSARRPGMRLSKPRKSSSLSSRPSELLVFDALR